MYKFLTFLFILASPAMANTNPTTASIEELRQMVVDLQSEVSDLKNQDKTWLNQQRADQVRDLVHDVLADDGAPLFQHPGDDGCVEVGDEAFEGEGTEAHGYTRHSDVVLVTYGLAGKQAFGRPLDPALPHPGVQRIFF